MAHEVEHELDQALVRLQARGWTQGTWADEEGRVCLAGALRGAYRQDIDGAEHITFTCDPELACAPVVGHVLMDTLRTMYPDVGPFTAIGDYNDLVLKTEAEAVAVMEKARAFAAEQGI